MPETQRDMASTAIPVTGGSSGEPWAALSLTGSASAPAPPSPMWRPLSSPHTQNSPFVGGLSAPLLPHKPRVPQEKQVRRHAVQRKWIAVCSGWEDWKKHWLLPGSWVPLMIICMISFAHRHSTESITTKPTPSQMSRETPDNVWAEIFNGILTGEFILRAWTPQTPWELRNRE